MQLHAGTSTGAHPGQDGAWTVAAGTSLETQVDALAGIDAMIASGRVSNAFVELDKLLATEPSRADAYISRSWANFKLMRWQAAESDASTAIELGSNNSYAWSNRARIRTVCWRIDEALADYEAALNVDPRSAAAHVGRALLWTQLGECSKALRCAEDARMQAGPTVEVLACIANIHLAHGDLASALETADEIIRQQPEDADNRVLRVRILCMLQEFDAALREVQFLAERDATSPAVLFAKSCYALDRHDFETLLAIGQTLMAVETDVWPAYVMQRTALTELRRYDEALQLSRDAMRNTGMLPEAGLDCVEALFALERPSEAESILDSMLVQYGHYPEVSLWHASRLVFLGRMAAAYEITKALHGKYPMHSGTWFDHALNCLRTARWQEALDCAAQQDAPNREFGAMLVRARANQELSSPAEALVAARRAFALLPEVNSRSIGAAIHELNTARCHSQLATLLGEANLRQTHHELARAAVAKVKSLLPAWRKVIVQDPLLAPDIASA